MELYNSDNQSFLQDKEKNASADKSRSVISLIDQKSEGIITTLMAVQDNTLFSSKSWKIVPDPYEYIANDGTKLGKEDSISLALVVFENGQIGEIVYSSRVTSFGWSTSKELEFF